jgi:TPR repeat protein
MYMNGTGVEKDDVKALFWTQRAEKAGLIEAKYTLALMHVQGEGVGQDLQKSYDYLNAYIKAGNTSPKTAELSERIKQSVGESGYSCMTYGFRQGTPSFAQCQMQADQAERLAQQQAQLSRQQAQFAQQQAQYARQQYELQAQQYQRQLAAERRALEREEQAERDAASERLFQMSEDMLCPKKTRGGIFAEPVAGCGRNKNEPKAPTVNVYVTPEKKYCGATAAGPLRC